jgi:hypothetical protein
MGGYQVGLMITIMSILTLVVEAVFCIFIFECLCGFLCLVYAYRLVISIKYISFLFGKG